MKLAHRIGLSVNLDELGFSDINENEIILVAKKATMPEETIHNKPYEVAPERVADTMKTANTIGIEVVKQYPMRKFQKHKKFEVSLSFKTLARAINSKHYLT